MMIRPFTLLAGLMLACAPARPAAPDPLDAQARTPPLQHRSTFEGYRRHADDPPARWRDANDAVARIGGWRSYAREAAAAAKAAPTAPPASAAVPPAGPAAVPGHRH